MIDAPEFGAALLWLAVFVFPFAIALFGLLEYIKERNRD